MTTEGDVELRGSTNLTITLRDNDTMAEVVRSVSIFTANQREARRQLAKAFTEALNALWPTEDGDSHDRPEEGSGSRSADDRHAGEERAAE